MRLDCGKTWDAIFINNTFVYISTTTSFYILLPASENWDAYGKGGRILTSRKVIMSLT
jgi:hypothetical protein